MKSFSDSKIIKVKLLVAELESLLYNQISNNQNILGFSLDIDCSHQRARDIRKEIYEILDEPSDT